jgi:hypothetical protein
MSSSIADNYCNKLETIPQFSGTCWFNSIITVMLYSQGFRKELTKILRRRRKTSDDKLFNFILYMLRNYNNIEKLKKVYKEFNNLDLKPEYLLVSYLKKYDENKLKEIIERIKIAGHRTYIYDILTNYKIPFLSLMYHNDSIYIDKDKISGLNYINIIYIIYNLEPLQLFDVNNPLIHGNKYKELTNEITNYEQLLKTVKEKNTIITLNNNSYKLDCCLIGNNNKAIGGHAITGITCNNKKYIIDSINKDIIDETPYKNSKKYKETLTPCKPILYDWDKLTNICISSECNVITATKTRLCFDLDISNIILVFIKIDSNTKSSSISFDEKNLISNDFKFNKDYKSIYVKEMFINLKYKTNDELINILKNYYLDSDLNCLKVNITNTYFLLYEKLVKQPLDISKNKEDLLKDIYLELLYKYHKNGIIYKLIDYTDDKTIYKIIYNLSIINDENLNKIKKEYYELINKSDISKYSTFSLELYKLNINNIYYLLFVKYKSFYDKNIIKLNDDIDKQLILKLLIFKEFFKKKYNIIFKEIIDAINKFIFNINSSISYYISIDKFDDIYENEYHKYIIKENSEEIYNFLFELNKDFYDNNIIETFSELNIDESKENYINIKLFILKKFFPKKYKSLIKKIINNYKSININYLYILINKYSLLNIKTLLNIYNDTEEEYYEKIITENTEEIYNFLFTSNKDIYDNYIIKNKNNIKKILIKLIILKECFNKNSNKQLNEINYKRLTGKQMRSRTNSSSI